MVKQSVTEHEASIASRHESSNDSRPAMNVMTVVVAIIERGDRRILIGQRRSSDTSPLKWEFPGGKLDAGEIPETGLGRELMEELGVTLQACVEIGRVQRTYAKSTNQLEIRFFAVEIADGDVQPKCFEQISWVLPKELGNYDFLEANRVIIAQLATGKIKPAELLRNAEKQSGDRSL